MDTTFCGVVVEEALDDNRLINNLHVEKIHITGQQNKADRWHMYQVRISLSQIDELANHIIDDWYIHFWNKNEVIAVFSGNKQFRFDYDNMDTWKDVIAYGRSIGIPDEQLDFPISGL